MYRLLVWGLLILVTPSLAGAAPCWKKMLSDNQAGPEKSEYSLVVLPFDNATRSADDKWIAMAIPLLLNEYLSLGKKVSVIPPDTAWWEPTFDPQKGLAVARSLGASHLILGRLFRKNEGLQVETILLLVKEGSEIVRVNGVVEYPSSDRLNDFLLSTIETWSQHEKKIGLKAKKILPFLNKTTSPDALRFYVAGSLLLREDHGNAPQEALKKFEESVKLDYNYVPGYLGLAEALVAAGTFQDLKGGEDPSLWRRARLEVEKAKLLNPPYATRRTPLIEKYLQAFVHKEAGRNFVSQGKLPQAIGEYRQATQLLPGDLAAHQRILDLSKDSKQAQGEEKIVADLNRCGNGSH